jgi:(E)-4-hydroxy-3-methylbut-2-enyl-diphosphate synthase
VGIAGGAGTGILFKKGEVVRRNIPQDQLVAALLAEVDALTGEALR